MGNAGRTSWAGLWLVGMVAAGAYGGGPGPGERGEGADPVYREVKPELFRPRGGLPNVLGKLAAGREVRIAYFGGSITAMGGWRTKTLTWFRKTWPKAKIEEINAAIGGTGSDLGAFRCGQDVIAHKPDLVFVEFAVNDGGQQPQTIWRAMEGIVRQIWSADPATDICYVYTIHTAGMPKEYARGVCPRSASSMELLADHYAIPSINVGLRVVQLAEAGKLIYKPPAKDAAGQTTPAPEARIVFARDDCHPLDAGHVVYTDVITRAIGELSGVGTPGPHTLATPFIADHWGEAKIVPLSRAKLTAGWQKLDEATEEGKRFRRNMKEVWKATQPGEKISFRFQGPKVQLYDIVGPDGGQAVCTVDGKRSKPRPRFDRYCSYHRIAVLNVADNLDRAKVHTVEVEVDRDQPDRSIVTGPLKDDPKFDPKRYDGTVLRVGGIMLIGDIVE